MDMKTEDLFYWSGLIGGIVLGHKLISPYGLHNVITLIASLAVGVGVGYICETTYTSLRGMRSGTVGRSTVPTSVKKCTKCNSQNEADAVYCITCGTQFK